MVFYSPTSNLHRHWSCRALRHHRSHSSRLNKGETGQRPCVDLERQIIYVDLVYRVEEGDGDIVEPLALSYFYEPQMRSLLEAQGFRIVAEYGYFDGRPIADGPELIFVVSN